MSPTIWGDHTKTMCSDCGIESIANWQPEMRPRSEVRCWNCGGRVPTHDLTPQPGELISIDTSAYQDSPPTVNEIVAIRDQDVVRIKRIVAGPGQTISVIEGLLFRDDSSMTTTAPWLTVHDDSHRWGNDSWWQSSSPIWSKTEAGFSVAVKGSQDQPATLIYGHRSPYHGLRPDVVGDDHAGNLTESRQLRQVDKLRLEADIQVLKPTTIELWNWTRSGIKHEQRILSPGIHALNTAWKKASIQEAAPAELDAEHPIVIHVEIGTVKITNLLVTRPPLYWVDDGHHSPIPSPTKLGEEEFFVIGDNVPLSIDSRHTGPLKRSAIIGKVVHDTSLPAGN